MKKEMDRNLVKQLDGRQEHEKANTVFLKLYSKIRSRKNPFDEMKSMTYPTNEIKPGGTINDPV